MVELQLTKEQLELSLMSLDNSANSLSYLDFLVNEINTNNYVNREELLEVIENKKKELSNTEEITNEDTLQELQQQNNDFYKINIIHSDKLNNDCGKDVEYLTYQDENNRVHILECNDQVKLIQFINEKYGDSYTAKDLFDYFKNKYKEVEFYKEDKFENENPDLASSAVFNDEETKAIEMDKVKEYAKYKMIVDEIEVSVDTNGERLYRLGDTLLKFETRLGVRTLIELQDEYMLNEKEENSKTENTGIEIKNGEQLQNETALGVSSITNEQFEELVIQAFDYHANLNGTQIIQMTNFVGTLVHQFEETAEKTDLTEEELNNQNLLEFYMDRALSSYTDMQLNVDPDFNLSEEQIAQVEAYIVLNEKKQEFKKQHDNTYTRKLTQDNSNIGMANYFIILELCSLATILMMFMANR